MGKLSRGSDAGFQMADTPLATLAPPSDDPPDASGTWVHHHPAAAQQPPLAAAVLRARIILRNPPHGACSCASVSIPPVPQASAQSPILAPCVRELRPRSSTLPATLPANLPP